MLLYFKELLSPFATERYTKDTILSQVLRGKNEVEGCNKAKPQARVFLQSTLSKWSHLEMHIHLPVFANHEFFLPKNMWSVEMLSSAGRFLIHFAEL